MAVFREATDAAKKKVSTTVLKLKDSLKRVSTQIETELQAAILRIRTKLKRVDGETLQNVAACQAVLQNRAVEARHGLPDTTGSAVGFDADVAFLEFGQKVDVVLNQACDDVIKTGGSKGHLEENSKIRVCSLVEMKQNEIIFVCMFFADICCKSVVGHVPQV